MSVACLTYLTEFQLLRQLLSFFFPSPAALVPAWYLQTVICAQVSQQHLSAV